MNCVILMGRLTREPEMKYTQSGDALTNFSLAVERSYKDSEGNRPTDFFPCVAWRKTAEYVGQYCDKGQRIAVRGSLKTRSYTTQDGQERHVTEIDVNNVEILETKAEAEARRARNSE